MIFLCYYCVLFIPNFSTRRVVGIQPGETSMKPTSASAEAVNSSRVAVSSFGCAMLLIGIAVTFKAPVFLISAGLFVTASAMFTALAVGNICRLIESRIGVTAASPLGSAIVEEVPSTDPVRS